MKTKLKKNEDLQSKNKEFLSFYSKKFTLPLFSGSFWWSQLLSRRQLFGWHCSWARNECECLTTLPSKEGSNCVQRSTIDWSGEAIRKSKVNFSKIKKNSVYWLSHLLSIHKEMDFYPWIFLTTLFVLHYHFSLKKIIWNNIKVSEKRISLIYRYLIFFLSIQILVYTGTCWIGSRSWFEWDTSENLVSE